MEPWVCVRCIKNCCCSWSHSSFSQNETHAFCQMNFLYLSARSVYMLNRDKNTKTTLSKFFSSRIRRNYPAQSCQFGCVSALVFKMSKRFWVKSLLPTYWFQCLKFRATGRQEKIPQTYGSAGHKNCFFFNTFVVLTTVCIAHVRAVVDRLKWQPY